MSPRALVVSASMGEGHDGAARELVRRLEARGCEAKMVDFLESAPLRIGDLTRTVYGAQLRFAPWAYEITYRIWGLLPFLCGPLVRFVCLLTRRQHMRWIDEWQPDVVVTTYPLASLVLGRLRQQGRIKVPVVTFVTDFAVHPLWVHPGVDLNLCVHPMSAAMATKRTGRPSRAPGPMVSDRLRHGLPSREEARKSLGIDSDERVVLVVAGSWGVGKIDKTFQDLLDSGRFSPIVMCGKNEEVRARLAAKGAGRVLGWTDQMPALMAAADAIVQNAGGLTCMEAFSVGVPVVTFRPIAGHGRENAKDMEQAGVAAFARSAGDLMTTLDRVTGPAGEKMRAAGKAMFTGDAAEDVMGLVAGDNVVSIPLPRPGHRKYAVAAMAALVAYCMFTVGVGAATALGIGVTRNADPSGDVFLAVRLDSRAMDDPALPAQLAHYGVTALVLGNLAEKNPAAVKRLTAAGVDVANGGWGVSDGEHWRRAYADLVRSGRAIRVADGKSCSYFVPGRRIDGFDVSSARLVHQRVAVARAWLKTDRALPKMQPGSMYVLDTAAFSGTDIGRELEEIRIQLADAHLVMAPMSQMR